MSPPRMKLIGIMASKRDTCGPITCAEVLDSFPLSLFASYSPS